ncbi:hypothetical protein KCG44_02645 [Pacificimonas sp. WHA3]|uniref:Uncharacterized protein n=1 Tax=Pacificimonas pallii TaxID=2827236 RepID=A0ABS6SB88_9SPHN|nr:hypothetical protein [Pacificimonas pallii]
MLDSNGGTALFQTRCARLWIRTGRDDLRCVHLTDKPTLRWYAACCRTPMFNSYATGRVPYLTAFVANLDSDRRAQVLGPPVSLLFAEEATGDVGKVSKFSMPRFILRFVLRMAKDIIGGDRRRSPLFEPQSLRPISPPRRLEASDTKIP